MRNLYPFSAALTMIGFDTSSYTGSPEKGSLPLAVLSLGSMFAVSILLVLTAKMPESAGQSGKVKKNPALRSSQGARPHM